MAWDDYEDREIAEGFKKTRQKAGISLKSLANFTGLSEIQLQDLEMAHYSPSREEWKLLREGIEALGRSVPNAKHYVDIHEAILITGKSRRTVYRWAENKEVATIVVSGVLYFDGMELLKRKFK